MGALAQSIAAELQVRVSEGAFASLFAAYDRNKCRPSDGLTAQGKDHVRENTGDKNPHKTS